MQDWDIPDLSDPGDADGGAPGAAEPLGAAPPRAPAAAPAVSAPVAAAPARPVPTLPPEDALPPAAAAPARSAAPATAAAAPRVAPPQQATPPPPEPPAPPASSVPLWQPAADMPDGPEADALLQACLWMTRHHGRERSAASLLAGVPLRGGLQPDQAVRVLQEAGYHAQLLARPLQDLSNLLLPVIALLRDGDACVITRRIFSPDGGDTHYEIVLAGASAPLAWCPRPSCWTNTLAMCWPPPRA
ncbi:cysteine peptidase family C39 domain-containing protein [Ideonella paludis]|uniref:hypothetical protein n=1 Tax=Ideonella paludis TaxID=1233411 RepID=UPI00362639FF